jgi:hypothetical protein
MPPTQRHKSRYLNIEKLIKWGTKILTYQDIGNYSEISTQFRLESDSLEFLKEHIPNKAVKELEGLVNQTYQSQPDFEVAVKCT